MTNSVLFAKWVGVVMFGGCFITCYAAVCYYVWLLWLGNIPKEVSRRGVITAGTVFLVVGTLSYIVYRSFLDW